jgi:hypothetical protein
MFTSFLNVPESKKTFKIRRYFVVINNKNACIYLTDLKYRIIIIMRNFVLIIQ